MKKNAISLILLAFMFIVFSVKSYTQSCIWDTFTNTSTGISLNYIINDMAIDHNDHIWIATSGFGLIEFDGDTTWHVYTNQNTAGQLPSNDIWKVVVDENNYIWAASDSGVTRFTGSAWNTYNSNNSALTGNDILAMTPDKQGNMWFSADGAGGTKANGVAFFDNNSTWIVFDTSTVSLASNDISDIEVDIYENVWFASRFYPDSGITRFDGTNWTTFNDTSYPLVNIDHIRSDKEGNLWVHTNYSNQIGKFDGNQWTLYDIYQGLYDVTTFSTDLYGNIWIGTYMGALSFDRDTTWALYDVSNGLPDNNVIDIESDCNGYIWFATGQGIGRLNTNSAMIVNVYNNTTPVEGFDVNLELYSADIMSATGEDSLIIKLNNSTQFNFNFPLIPPGNYYLKAVVTDTSTLTNVFDSYYNDTTSTYNWEEATIISLDQCDNLSLSLYMFQNTNTMPPGTGTISGNISYINGFKSKGEPVPGAEVYIEQEPNDQPVLNSETDSNGDYSFTDIPDGSLFKLSVDIPGLPQIETYDSLTFSSSITSYVNLDFIVDTSGIFVQNSSGITIPVNDNFSFNLYPNPAQDNINIQYSIDKNSCDVQIKIVDIYGKEIQNITNKNQETGVYQYTLNMSQNISSGIYFIYLSINHKTYVKKLILN